MARIRKVGIHNYRAIQRFEWFPSNCINCIVGPGDLARRRQGGQPGNAVSEQAGPPLRLQGLPLRRSEI